MPIADVELRGVRARQLAAGSEQVEAAIVSATRLATAWVGAAEVATAQRLLDMAVAYARTRVQFGMAIAERQAIKHKCADMLMVVESARSALWSVLSNVNDDAALALLRVASGRALDLTAQQSLQIHGGIGFTWEHDLHFLFRRATVSRHLFGSDESHYATIMNAALEKA
nr:acyl-CoA dehydrogenase family protein [Microbacterium sp. NC79]